MFLFAIQTRIRGRGKFILSATTHRTHTTKNTGREKGVDETELELSIDAPGGRYVQEIYYEIP